MPADPRGPVGRPLPRLEDGPLLVGEASFVADVPADGALEAVFVRSQHAHGVIRSIELDDARAVNGVVGVFAAADLPGLPRMPPAPGVEVQDAMARPSLAVDRVRFVGEPVAVVLAEDLARAEDAAELVLAEVEPLPVVLDPTEAASRDAIPLFEGVGNVAEENTVGEPVDDALAAAPVVLELEFRQRRVAHVSIETRRILVVPDGSDGLTARCSHQAPHRLRSALAGAFGLDPGRVRVIVEHVGGAFGGKSQTWPEYLVVADLARRFGRPVRWIEGRSESFVGASHGRGQNLRIRLGADEGGRILALDAEVDVDAGAYPHTGSFIAGNTAWMMSGAYRIPRIRVRSRSVVTNATPTAPYRGAGRPEAAFGIERAVDVLASRLGLDPAEVRRRNFIPPDAFPYRSPTGALYDGARHAEALDLALRTAGYDAIREEQQRRRPGEPLVGVGIASWVERSGGATGSTEHGAVEVTADGRVLARTGSSSQGQGHRTAFAQIVAAALGVEVGDVEVIQGDTAEVAEGTGTFGSRSMQIGGSALHLAAAGVLEAAWRVAAEELEVAVEDLVHRDGGFEVTGSPDRRRSLLQLAATAGGFAEARVYASPQAFPYGAYVAVVEVDAETGLVRLRRMVAVDDCGTVVNPLLAEGQVVGSLAQGIGQALLEGIELDEHGEPLTTNLATYAVPTTSEMAETITRSIETPTDGPLGAKGAGESGSIGAPPAVVNAVADALRGYETDELEMPITPEQVWRILRRGPAAVVAERETER